MSRDKRKQIIDQIEKKRKSKVITYVTSDRQGLQVQIAGDIVSILHEHIMLLDNDTKGKVDLFLYSRGGATDVPWAVVSMFREYCQKGSFSVLLPYRAHSAASLISLGADEIVMTKKAELGPIDATIQSGSYNPQEQDTPQRLPVSVEDVTGYFAFLDRIGCGRSEEKMKGFEYLTSHLHPLALGAVSRLLEQTKLVGLRLLSTRAKPFTEEENHEIIKRLSSEVYSHSYAINRTESVKYLGLKQVKHAETIGIDNEMWDLYKEYRDLFQLETSFFPEEELIAQNLEEKTWPNLNLACVESVKRLDMRTITRRVRRLRNVPPQVTLNLNNIAFPPLTIPNLPQSMDPAQVKALVEQVVKSTMQQCLNNGIQVAIQQLVTSLPLSRGLSMLRLTRSGQRRPDNAT